MALSKSLRAPGRPAVSQQAHLSISPQCHQVTCSGLCATLGSLRPGPSFPAQPFHSDRATCPPTPVNATPSAPICSSSLLLCKPLCKSLLKALLSFFPPTAPHLQFSLLDPCLMECNRQTPKTPSSLLRVWTSQRLDIWCWGHGAGYLNPGPAGPSTGITTEGGRDAAQCVHLVRLQAGNVRQLPAPQARLLLFIH